MQDVTEQMDRVSLTLPRRPASPAYPARCTDPANEPGVRVRVHTRAFAGNEGLVAGGGSGSGISGQTRVDIDGTVYSVPSRHTEFVTVDATTPAGTGVVVVCGTSRGCIGTLHSLAYDDYACVTFTDGDISGRVLQPRACCALIGGR